MNTLQRARKFFRISDPSIEGQINNIIKRGNAVIDEVNTKDVSDGYAGLTLFKINFKNVLGTIVSFFTNSNTVPRTYTFPDISGTPVLREGAENLTGAKTLSNLILPKTSGVGIRVDEVSPTFGWHDIIGKMIPKAIGVGSPTRAVYNGANLADYFFALNDLVDLSFHTPHDYLPGSDIFVHLHWSHNGTAISGNAVFTLYHSYAKGHNQTNFPAEKIVSISYDTVDITTTPQYRHRIDEIPITSSGGSATLVDSASIEIDGIHLIAVKLTTLPTITGGKLFIHFADLHYQSTNMTTKQKAPNFYV